MSFFSELKRAGKRSLPDRKTGSEKAVFFIAFTLLALYCLSLIYPFFWMFLNSLKGSLEYSGGNTFALPEKWLFSNYAQAFTMLKLDNGITFFDMIFNSVWYTVLGAGLGVFASSITGYCLSKYKFKGRNLIYSIAIFAMTIPIVGTAAASFKFTRESAFTIRLYTSWRHRSAAGDSTFWCCTVRLKIFRGITRRRCLSTAAAISWHFSR